MWVWGIALAEKVWCWWKKWWKWVLFPVGLASMVFAGRRVLDQIPDGSATFSLPPEDKTVTQVRNVLVERDQKLEELKAEYQEKLLWLNEEQRRELEQLEVKSTEEVVTWFDKLSSS